MTFWSGRRLSNVASRIIVPFDKKKIDMNAYNLSMGSQYYVTADYKVKSIRRQKRKDLADNEAFVIPSGQFAFLLSKEYIHLPKNAMAFISMRTSVKFKGLINVSGFHVDPGYKGKLIYSVYNASPSPIQLSEGSPVFKIWFCDIDDDSDDSFAKGEKDGQWEITNEMVHGMNRENITISSLKREVSSIKTQLTILTSIFGAGVSIFLAVFVAIFSGTGNYLLQHLLFGHSANSSVTSSIPPAPPAGQVPTSGAAK